LARVIFWFDGRGPHNHLLTKSERTNGLLPYSHFSIYNNQSGFTHDYYSGATAKPAAPTTCLGERPGRLGYRRAGQQTGQDHAG